LKKVYAYTFKKHTPEDLSLLDDIFADHSDKNQLVTYLKIALSKAILEKYQYQKEFMNYSKAGIATAALGALAYNFFNQKKKTKKLMSTTTNVSPDFDISKPYVSENQDRGNTLKPKIKKVSRKNNGPKRIKATQKKKKASSKMIR
jgi:hypothetical protein